MTRKSERELERELADLAEQFESQNDLGWFDVIEIVNGVTDPEEFGLTFDEAAEEMAAAWEDDVPDRGLEFYEEHVAAPLRTDDAAKAVAFALAITADGTHTEGRQRALSYLIDDATAGENTRLGRVRGSWNGRSSG